MRIAETIQAICIALLSIVLALACVAAIIGTVEVMKCSGLYGDNASYNISTHVCSKRS